LEVPDASILKVEIGRNLMTIHQTKWHHIPKGCSLTMFSLAALENVREFLAKMLGCFTLWMLLLIIIDKLSVIAVLFLCITQVI